MTDHVEVSNLPSALNIVASNWEQDQLTGKREGRRSNGLPAVLSGNPGAIHKVEARQKFGHVA